MRRLLLIPAAVLVLAVAGGTMWIAWQGDALTVKRATGVAAPPKSFSTEIAEGVRLRDFEHFGVDLLSFGACRIEKLKRGGVTLGAFNVLVLDDVTVNLVDSEHQIINPLNTQKDTEKEFKTENGQSTNNAERIDAFIGRFKSVRELTGKKFSGVHINRLTVNRLTDNGSECLFAAELAEGGLGSGKALRLKGCLVFTDGNRGVPVCDARVEVNSVPTLVYRLSDGQENRIPLQ